MPRRDWGVVLRENGESIVLVPRDTFPDIPRLGEIIYYPRYNGSVVHGVVKEVVYNFMSNKIELTLSGV